MDPQHAERDTTAVVPTLVEWLLQAPLDGAAPSGDGRAGLRDTLPADLEPTEEALAAWEQLLRLAQQDLRRRQRESATLVLSDDDLLALALERDRVLRYRTLMSAPGAGDHDGAARAHDPCDLAAALERGAIVAQAQGMLMARHEIPPDAAFALLVRLAQQLEASLPAVAAQVVASTETWDD